MGAPKQAWFQQHEIRALWQVILHDVIARKATLRYSLLCRVQLL
jgi:hypothetical protein